LAVDAKHPHESAHPQYRVRNPQQHEVRRDDALKHQGVHREEQRMREQSAHRKVVLLKPTSVDPALP